MKLLIASLLAASAIVIAAPASAQGVYLGGRGAGIGLGLGGDPYYGGGYYNDGYDEPAYQGRSVYRGRGVYRGGQEDPYYYGSESDPDDIF